MCLDEKENDILAAEIAVWGYMWGVGGPGQNIHVLCMEDSCTLHYITSMIC